MNKRPPADVLVLFGATGDLAHILLHDLFVTHQAIMLRIDWLIYER